MKVLTEQEEYLGKQVVEVAYHLHKALGRGLLEKVYESCFCYELSKRNTPFITQLKAQENYHPVWEAQLLSYLRLSNKRLSYIINFTVPLINDGIKRMVL